MKFWTVLLWALGVALGGCLLYIAFLAICAALVDDSREYDRDSGFYRHLLYGATACCIRLLHIRIDTEGLEKIPENTPFLLVCNHRSNFDPILTWQILKPYRMAFVSKPENFQIPIFGRFIRRCCFLAIDRENPRNALITIEKAADLLKSGQVNMGIYPEGTRSKDCVILPFHNGVFKIAQKADAPIVVAAIEGTEAIHKNWYRWKASPVHFEILEVLPGDFVRENRTAAIGQRVRQDFIQALDHT